MNLSSGCNLFCVFELQGRSPMGLGELSLNAVVFDFFAMCWDLFHSRVQGHGKGCVSL